jgi:hypothetical protein
MGVLLMKGRERMWKNECVSTDLFTHVIFCLLNNFKKKQKNKQKCLLKLSRKQRHDSQNWWFFNQI